MGRNGEEFNGMATKTSVITPVWNQAHLTGQFLLANWKLYHNRPDIEFIIIDNGSVDGTPDLLDTWRRRIDDRLKVIRNEDNAGFAVANNQGAQEAAGDILVFANNDIEIRGDWLNLLADCIECSPYALAGADLLAHNTGWNTFDGAPIQYLAGWCVAMAKKTYQDLGGWDVRYTPGDYEDIDLSYTARRRGLDLIHVILPVRHLSGQTARQLPDRRAMTERHRVLFIKKWGLNEFTTA